MRAKVFIAAVLLSVATTAFFLIKKKKASHVELPDQLEKEIKRTRSGIFHPDSVVGFEWKVREKLFKFERKNRNLPWSHGGGKGVQERLLFLSLLEIYELAEEASTEPIKVQLKIYFPNDLIWTAAWDGERLFWVDGSFAGFGATLSDEENQLFEAGRFAFTDRSFDWCHDRLMSVENTTAPELFIAKAGLHWQNQIKEKLEMNSTQIEQWLGQHCTVQVDQYVDLDLIRLPQENISYFEVVFADRTKIRWPRIGQSRFQLKDRGFSSNSFVQGLHFLSELE